MDPVQDLKDIFLQAVKRVDPFEMICRRLEIRDNVLEIRADDRTLLEDLSRYDRILVLGIGKASSNMAMAVESVFQDRITDGVVVTKYGHARRLERISVIQAAHPVPDQNSIKGAEAIYALAAGADEKTLIINLISGGGSALFCLPEDGVDLEDKQKMTRILLDCGADIQEVNAVRKHISKVKGGKFARVAYPARMINLILSDVIGDRLDTIASGIAVPDATTFEQAQRILGKYHVIERTPESIIRYIRMGVNGLVEDTPKQGDECLQRVDNILLGNNLAACIAARSHGDSLGYNTCILTASLSGEAREIARFFSSMARDIRSGVAGFKRPALLIAGGETTVTIRGKGKGGRNQEMSLAFLTDLLVASGDLHGISFLSAGTDGNDGPTDAAGAFVSGDIVSEMKRLDLDPLPFLEDNNAYPFFDKTGHLLITGPTNTNVCDIQLLIVG
ncbi:MAG: glycerate kinase [Thermodesulfobacteriota bacterium]|nr:glycerate kinase [Thermodesulfobacteriota bacterium]